MSIVLGVSPATSSVNKLQSYAAVVPPYTTTAADQNLTVSGTSGTITLHTAVGNKGQFMEIVHNGTSLTQVYTFNTTSGQTIGGIASGAYAFYTNQESFRLVSDGANWIITDRSTNTVETDAGALWISKSSAYSFTIPSSSITAGTTYTNNGFTYIVSTTSASSVTLLCYGTGTPTSGTSTLVFVSGTPSGNITYTAITSTGAYVKPTGALYDRFVWYRTGKYCNYRWEFSSPNNGTAGTGDDLLFLPTGLSPDTTNMGVNTAILGAAPLVSGSDLGFGYAWIGGAANQLHMVPAWPGTMKAMILNNDAWSTGAGTLNTAPRWSVRGQYPVTGWQP